MKKSKTKEKDWTEPDFLSTDDHTDLKEIKRLYEAGHIKQAYKYACGRDTIVREQIPLQMWKEMGGKLTPSGEAELRAEKKRRSKTIDYADELSMLKVLHEDNLGRKFADEQFNEIFSIAFNSHYDLFRHAQEFENELTGWLAILQEATDQWEEGIKKMTAIEAARDFVRPYLLAGDNYSLRPDGKLKTKTENYSAQIEEHNVVVTKLYKKEVHEEFHLMDIMSDIIYELAQK